MLARHAGALGVGLLFVVVAPERAEAAPICSSVAEFNAYMASNAASSDDVTLTFDVVGIKPSDFHNGKGSIAQMRNTKCQTGQDAVIKVYGTSDTYNSAHPPGTLKMEYGNNCCGLGTCGEKWASPNASAEIFKDGTEQCKVTMWIKPDSVGYKLECGGVSYDGLGDNDEKNAVDQIAMLEYFLANGGTTWEMPNAKATNDQVCYVLSGPPVQQLTVPVAEDVTVGPTWPTSVFPDVGDLAVEASDNQAYLKFVVPASVGKVTKATLFMHTRTESFANGDGGDVHPVSSNQWSESTLTWNARPPYASPSLGHIGPAAADQTVSVDLGSAITGPGTYSFAVVSPNATGNGTHFFSKEGSTTQAPYLKLSYDGADGGAGAAGAGGAAGNPGDAGVTGGTWGSGGAFGGSSATGGNPGNAGGTDEADDVEGCGCAVRPTGSGWLAAALALLGLVLRRTRRG